MADVLTDRCGVLFGHVFLIGFWAASFSSLIGVWNGVSLMFADFVGNIRGLEWGDDDTRVGGKHFKWYVAWLTFPPMCLLWLDQPIGLVLAYGVLGAIFMPFLAVTLLRLLNSDRVPRRWRNGWFTNLMLGACAFLFAWLAVDQVYDVLDKYVF